MLSALAADQETERLADQSHPLSRSVIMLFCTCAVSVGLGVSTPLSRQPLDILVRSFWTEDASLNATCVG